MNKEELLRAVQWLINQDRIIQAKMDDAGEVVIEVQTKNNRTQFVSVVFDRNEKEEDSVLTYSIIGEPPNDPDVLKQFLAENMDGMYSRIALGPQNLLVQIAKSEVKFLEAEEYLSAIIEIANFADYYEEKYFGVDEH